MRAVLAAVALLAGAQAASAQVVSYLHDGEAAFSLEYPPGWEIRTPRDPERPLLSALPADGSRLWQGVWALRAASLEEAVERMKAMEGRLFDDVELAGEPWTETVGELDLRCLAGSGLYEGAQPTEFFIALFDLPDEKMGAFAYMGDPAAIEVHRESLDGMLQSLEVTK